MKIFCGGIATETNSFAPFPTTYADFERDGLWQGDASASNSYLGQLILGWKEAATRGGHEFVEGLVASAQPSGPLTRSSYERLKNEFMRSFEDSAPYDLCLLFLHGAMIADGYEDCEGDMLKSLRNVMGTQGVIGAVLDPHCHLSEAMLRHADILVCAKEYPHSDYPERMLELFDLATKTVEGVVCPVPQVFDCQMIGFYPTTKPPMSEFVSQLKREESSSEALLSISFIHGFELGDVADLGSKVLVYTDGDPVLGREVASRLGRSIYKLRHTLLPNVPDVDQSIEVLKSACGRTVIADIGDNPGAGFSGDNMEILRRLLAARFDHIVAGCFWDPGVVSICQAVGVGAQLSLRIGGKSGVASGLPLDLVVTVKALRDEHTQSVFGVGRVSFGAVAWVSVEGADLVICSRREQVFSQDAFTGLGIDLEEAKIVLLKSGQHFYQSFAELAEETLYVKAPACIGLDLAAIPHRIRKLNYFPRLIDPLGLEPV